MFALLNTVFLVLTVRATSSTFRHDTANVFNDLATIDNSYKQLQQAALNINEHAASVVTVLRAMETLADDTNKATNDTKLGTLFTAVVAHNLVDYINGTLEPDLYPALKAVAAKKSHYEAAGLGTSFTAQIQQLEEDTVGGLRNALIAQSPPPNKPAFDQVFDKIYFDFLDAFDGKHHPHHDLRSLDRRDFTTLYNDLKKIHTDIQTLRSSIDNWDGTIAGSVAIQTNFNAVDKDLNQTTADSNALPARLSSPNSRTLINYMNNPILPDIKSVVQAFNRQIERYPSDSQTMANDRSRFRDDMKMLCQGLQSKVSTSDVSDMKSVCDKIDAVFPGSSINPPPNS